MINLITLTFLLFLADLRQVSASVSIGPHSEKRKWNSILCVSSSENLRKCLLRTSPNFGKLLAIISNKNSVWILYVPCRERKSGRQGGKIYRRLSRFDGLASFSPPPPPRGLRLIVSFDATVSHRIGHFRNFAYFQGAFNRRDATLLFVLVSRPLACRRSLFPLQLASLQLAVLTTFVHFSLN